MELGLPVYVDVYEVASYLVGALLLLPIKYALTYFIVSLFKDVYKERNDRTHPIRDEPKVVETNGVGTVETPRVHSIAKTRRKPVAQLRQRVPMRRERTFVVETPCEGLIRPVITSVEDSVVSTAGEIKSDASSVRVRRPKVNATRTSRLREQRARLPPPKVEDDNPDAMGLFYFAML